MSDIDLNTMLPLIMAQTDADDFYDDDEDTYEGFYDDDDDEAFTGEWNDDDEESDYSPFESIDDLEDDWDDDEDGMYDAGGDAEFFGRRARRRRRLRAKRRRYRRVRSRARKAKVRGSRSVVLQSANGRRVPVKLSTKFAKANEVNASISSIEKRLKAALAERRTNHDALAKQIANNTKALNAKVRTVQKKVKGLEASAQTAQLMSLITEPPKLEKFNNGKEDVTVTNPVYTSPDMMLPLLLSSMGGGGGSGDNGMMLALAISQMNK